MKLLSLILFLLGGALAGLFTANYIAFLDFANDTSAQIAAIEPNPTPESVRELGQWHAQAYATFRKKFEWVFLGAGMLALVLFLNFVRGMSQGSSRAEPKE